MLNIYTGGTYDCGHLGHLAFIKKIKKYFPDSYIVVALNTDEFIERYKGKKPVFSYKERADLLIQIAEINEIVENIGNEDSTKTILSLSDIGGIDVIAIGNDWLEKDYCKQMGFNAQWLTDHHITLAYLPHSDGISTSLIKERLLNA